MLPAKALFDTPKKKVITWGLKPILTDISGGHVGSDRKCSPLDRVALLVWYRHLQETLHVTDAGKLTL